MSNPLEGQYWWCKDHFRTVTITLDEIFSKGLDSDGSRYSSYFPESVSNFVAKGYFHTPTITNDAEALRAQKHIGKQYVFPNGRVIKVIDIVKTSIDDIMFKSEFESGEKWSVSMTRLEELEEYKKPEKPEELDLPEINSFYCSETSIVQVIRSTPKYIHYTLYKDGTIIVSDLKEFKENYYFMPKVKNWDEVSLVVDSIGKQYEYKSGWKFEIVKFGYAPNGRFIHCAELSKPVKYREHFVVSPDFIKNSKEIKKDDVPANQPEELVSIIDDRQPLDKGIIQVGEFYSDGDYIYKVFSIEDDVVVCGTSTGQINVHLSKAGTWEHLPRLKCIEEMDISGKQLWLSTSDTGDTSPIAVSKVDLFSTIYCIRYNHLADGDSNPCYQSADNAHRIQHEKRLPAIFDTLFKIKTMAQLQEEIVNDTFGKPLLRLVVDQKIRLLNEEQFFIVTKELNGNTIYRGNGCAEFSPELLENGFDTITAADKYLTSIKHQIGPYSKLEYKKLKDMLA